MPQAKKELKSFVTTLFEHLPQRKSSKRLLDLRSDLRYQCSQKSVKLLITTEQLGLTGLN